MSDIDFGFVPHSDTSPDELSILEEHKNLIKQNNYSDAATLLDNNDFKKGFRASLFNVIEKKIQDIEIYLLNKIVAEPDELYSITEPSTEEMKDKVYWIKPF